MSNYPEPQHPDTMNDLAKSSWEKIIDAAIRIYGPLALVCLFFAYQIQQKDAELKARYMTQLEMTRIVTAALADNSAALERLSYVIDRTQEPNRKAPHP